MARIGFNIMGTPFEFLTRRVTDGRITATCVGDLYASGWCKRARKDQLERAMLDAVDLIDAGLDDDARTLLLRVLRDHAGSDTPPAVVVPEFTGEGGTDGHR